MIRPIPRSFFTRALAWTSVAALSGAVAMAQNATASAAAQRTDGQIEMDVVHALDASKALKKDLITAATIQGEVTLAGTVSSEASAELAESLVARIPGVVTVHNTLKVGDPKEIQNLNATSDSAPSNDAQPQEADVAAPSATDGPLPVPAQPSTAQEDAQDAEAVPAQAPMQLQPPPPPVRPQYAPVPPPTASYRVATAPVTIPAGTLLQLRTNESVNSKDAKEGTPIQFTVIRDVLVGGQLAIPRGATVHGVVSATKKAGQLSGTPELSLQLTSLDLGNRSYDLVTDAFKVKGPNKAGESAGKIFGGALLGAIIGGMADRGTGAAIGAGVGAGAGTVASATSNPNAWIPAEALVDFHLQGQLTVQPVTQAEANRLAQGLYPGGPVLYRRPYPGYPYGYAHPTYYYAYPPVYYHPYYVVGGAYYWR